MKWLSIACLGAFAALAVSAEGLGDVKAVYLMPMSHGLDQFLAERLTAQGIVQVVTDPDKADFIFSDRIGAAFQDRLTELYKAKKPEKRDEAEYTRPPSDISSRGKGNLFLVDRRNAQVLWSTYVEPGRSDPGDLNHTAAEIAGRLAKTLSQARKTK